MNRHLVALAALGLVFAALACGGGSSSSVTYAPTVVSIKRIDFTGVDLSAEDIFNPPVPAEYPQVVAEVNGESISAKQLASLEVGLEMTKRQAVDIPRPELAAQVSAEAEATDPLKAVTDEEIVRQAVERMGLVPSYAEAVTYTREREAEFDKLPLNEQELTLPYLRAQGMPTSDWASSSQLVDLFRYEMGVSRLRGELVKERMPDYKPSNSRIVIKGSLEDTVLNDFATKERKNAKIVYYVRWAD